MLLFYLFCLFPHRYEITCESRSVVIEAQHIEMHDYISLKTIAEVLDVNYVLNNNNQRLYLAGNGHQLVLIANINIIRHDSIYQNIPFAPIYNAGEVHVPVQALTTPLGSTFEKLVFVKEVKEAPRIDKISIFARGDSTVLKFAWENPVDFDVQFSPKKTIVEIDGLYSDEVKGSAKSIKSTKLIPYNTYTRLEFYIDNVNSFLERKDEVVFYCKPRAKVAVITIDPGHGGIDPGAVGKKGLYEKDVNLDIAKFLKKFIEDSLGIKVVLTREKDIYLSLKERTNIANRNSADLFISLHCNASKSKDKKFNGFETFFLSEAKTDEARAVAALENEAIKFDGLEPTDKIGFILYDLAQSAFLEESNRFAEYIQSSAEKFLPIFSRGVNQAGFYVLHGAFMPAVLIETAFISLPEEEKQLRDKKFRKKVAYCVFRGIKNFVHDYERRINN